jgi:hypothetical protein
MNRLHPLAGKTNQFLNRGLWTGRSNARERESRERSAKLSIPQRGSNGTQRGSGRTVKCEAHASVPVKERGAVTVHGRYDKRAVEEVIPALARTLS